MTHNQSPCKETELQKTLLKIKTNKSPQTILCLTGGKEHILVNAN